MFLINNDEKGEYDEDIEKENIITDHTEDNDEVIEYSTAASSVLRIFGFLTIIIGFFGSIVYGSESHSFLVFFGCLVIVLISGFSFIGFAEIIDLLKSINIKLDKIQQQKK